jgi:hypothetical protein
MIYIICWRGDKYTIYIIVLLEIPFLSIVDSLIVDTSFITETISIVTKSYHNLKLMKQLPMVKQGNLENK